MAAGGGRIAQQEAQHPSPGTTRLCSTSQIVLWAAQSFLDSNARAAFRLLRGNLGKESLLLSSNSTVTANPGVWEQLCPRHKKRARREWLQWSCITWWNSGVRTVQKFYIDQVFNFMYYSSCLCSRPYGKKLQSGEAVTEYDAGSQSFINIFP